MTKVYRDERYCPFCDRETAQEVTDSEHERDSSGDYQECLECSATYWGFTGEWEPAREEKGDARDSSV
jgi:ribosomal protein L44E